MSVVRDMDLSEHLVVEASAGTGKTFTIEQIVLRLLEEQRVSLDEILLVTFTEKATGELKSRLRAIFEKTLREQPAKRDIFQPALDGFDQAPIFTIHGFCQRLLAEYALEQGQELRLPDLVNDAELLKPALREIQRRDWRNEWGAQLPVLLELAQYDRASAENWEKNVLKVAQQYLPEWGHVLRPAPQAQDLELDRMEDECARLFQDLKRLAGPIERETEKHPWVSVYVRLLAAEPTSSDSLDLVQSLLETLSRPIAEGQALRTFLDLERKFDLGGDRSEANGFLAVWTPFSEENVAKTKAEAPGLGQALDALEQFRQRGPGRRWTNHLAVRTVGDLHALVSRLKTERGLQSYNDMIASVARAFDPEQNPAAEWLRRLLRARFRYGIVDEFQDTDPLQWRILCSIFLEGGDTRLIVVGDPKQAIFGFRGADLPTYVQAAQEIVAEFGGVKEKLTTNWRAVEELLLALNALFQDSGWFPPQAGVDYVPVTAPPPAERLVRIDMDKSGRAALNIVKVADTSGKKTRSIVPFQRRFADFVANEIRFLLDSGLEFTTMHGRKNLDAGDITVLIQRRKEAEPLLKELRKKKLPFSFYKQYGLWSSEEATHLLLLLQALAETRHGPALRKALLTMFFRLGPADLTQCPEIPAAHPAEVLFERWTGWAAQRDWAALFQSILDDSGVLFDEKTQGELDRRASSLRYIIGLLQESAYRDNLDLLQLIEEYKRLQRRAQDPMADFFPVETDQPRIKIMTVHSSKGLEFPIVFFAGGFTQGGNVDLYSYRDEHNRKVFDLQPDDRAKAAYDAEDEAEDRRQLYVALTRAMLKLYVPLLDPELAKYTYAGPTVTLLAPALIAANPSKLGAHCALEISSVVQSQSRAKKPPAQDAESAPAETLAEDLIPHMDPAVQQRRIFFRSFSSLRQTALARAAEASHFGDETAPPDDDDAETPDDPLRGPAFGEIVHLVLENLDYAEVGAAPNPAALLADAAPALAVIDRVLEKHLPKLRSRTPLDALRAACRQQVASLAWHGLHTPLGSLGGPLWQVPAADRLHELEFLFPENEPAARPSSKSGGESFFTGYMDLVCRRDGKYFLLDWKTNLLDAYDPAALAEEMAQSDYHLQYRLYLQALGRWLKRVHGPRLDLAHVIGGVYYLFLRGMNGRDESTGVFFHNYE
ncbi:MAG: UvrD-helicase domain-containing protein [Gemmataceae bacterium]|nr:UvrD-helicase domain-containing protein [Gemmataceae bacterium]MCI0737827.1 UvrD-helicase domain-containing protein [Gemmataceae bacterium]